MALASIRYKPNKAAIDALLTGRGGPVITDLQRRAQRVANEAKRRCPVDEGTLRGSITVDITVGPGRKVTARVGSRLLYALFVHEGTGIYGPSGRPITPKSASVLRWPVRGTTSSRTSSVPGRGRVESKSLTASSYAYARSVKGVKPRRFLADALPAAIE